MNECKATKISANISKFGGGGFEKKDEFHAVDPKIIDAKVEGMKINNREKELLLGSGVGLLSGGLMGGSIGGGAGAIIGGIVGSIVPGPGTIIGVGIGGAIGAAVGSSGAGGLGTTIGYVATKLKKKKKTASY